ncbi:GNAT family N-acetyltransferase [Streptomyces sp. NL15-2K]|uniref:GNAT family N-acetyltransferase n=1 Tax=Streptomyces sp. NL15-2K TaxID=376149 RepID=UPI000F574E4F|nr:MULTISPECIES: GNAT family N-acetyltransferase [Actinomycetes]WKX10057.1 GNAT family N-acetyltransferase [Kutzneria buriramensis]GCB51670.1 leucine dehydrogenase [Streptomyces sp. NL15-2K]
MLDHEQVAIHTGRRSRLPVIVAVHSTALGPAAGGLRLWHYPDWRDGLTDALRLSAAMTSKFAVAGLPSGGGKAVVVLPEGTELDDGRRRDVLHDVADVIASLGGVYATGPDVGTGPEDMALIGEITPHVFCRPARLGGSGDSSPHTAQGTLAALRAVGRRLYGSSSPVGRRLAVVGLGRVGAGLARLLAAEGAALTVTDIDPDKRKISDELGAVWRSPEEILAADVDIVVPAALGSVLTRRSVADLRCRAVVGPANNQLATPDVADLLHQRGIIWVPDYVASAGGVINAVSTELHRVGADDARARVRAIEDTVDDLLDTARRSGQTPARAASELARRRLGAAGSPTASSRLRAAGPGDAESVALLHADSWRRHYRGAYSDAFLDGDVVADRRSVWSARLSAPGSSATVVAEDDTGLTGFVHVVFDEDGRWGSRVDNLHVTQHRRRSGLGTALLSRAAKAVTERARGDGMYLWVLEQNTAAQAFYQAMGGTRVEKAPVPAPGGVASRLAGSPAMLRFTWPDASLLAQTGGPQGVQTTRRTTP